MANKRATACGSLDCSVSSGIHDGLTFGGGELDDFGYWEVPCGPCARRHEEENPGCDPCWPFEDSIASDIADAQPGTALPRATDPTDPDFWENPGFGARVDATIAATAALNRSGEISPNALAVRQHPDFGNSTVEELEAVNCETWMVDCLQFNPTYPFWGPGEDAMYEGNSTTAQTFDVRRHDESMDLPEPDDYNEVVHFYFELAREGRGCSCDGGYNPAVPRNFPSRHNQLAPDDLAALKASGRVDKKKGVRISGGSNDNIVDGIDRHVMTQARADRMGVSSTCLSCYGTCVEPTEDYGHLNLVVWMIYPRKGRSRSWRYMYLSKEHVKTALEWLRKGAKRNAGRFDNIFDLATDMADFRGTDQERHDLYEEAEATAGKWMDRANKYRAT